MSFRTFFPAALLLCIAQPTLAYEWSHSVPNVYGKGDCELTLVDADADVFFKIVYDAKSQSRRPTDDHEIRITLMAPKTAFHDSAVSEPGGALNHGDVRATWTETLDYAAAHRFVTWIYNEIYVRQAGDGRRFMSHVSDYVFPLPGFDGPFEEFAACARMHREGMPKAPVIAPAKPGEPGYDGY
ncbi:hypothetical protein PVW46_18115 [Mameliella sp. AT18]|uniref:hypothetical protein n=1 Tax=Mameliella sp. AT18 TaxID=3028385 RepID=UPI0008411743|nr:hypothetical protein [Mameliella sp. AT18]MDD9731824.1 hypothetical protein [Mameliella sp. AT18]ODM50043.1 hypothetical protein A9320_11900 [Ruegeria sp. PBVC088]